MKMRKHRGFWVCWIRFCTIVVMIIFPITYLIGLPLGLRFNDHIKLMKARWNGNHKAYYKVI